MRRNLRNKKRGFALMEVLIALTVIAIVCGSVIIVTDRSVVTVQKEIRSSRAVLAAESVYQCFLYADSTAEFEAELISLRLEPRYDGEFYRFDFTGGVTLAVSVYYPTDTSSRPFFRAFAKNGNQTVFELAQFKGM